MTNAPFWHHAEKISELQEDPVAQETTEHPCRKGLPKATQHPSRHVKIWTQQTREETRASCKAKPKSNSANKSETNDSLLVAALIVELSTLIVKEF